jgi:hypothetical protein
MMVGFGVTYGVAMVKKSLTHRGLTRKVPTQTSMSVTSRSPHGLRISCWAILRATIKFSSVRDRDHCTRERCDEGRVCSLE